LLLTYKGKELRFMKLIIQGELPSLNQYIAAMNRNRYVGAKMKRDSTEIVRWTAFEQKLSVRTEPVYFHFHWVMKNKRMDLDNVAFAKKFILDGLIEAGVLYDDSQKWVKGFKDTFEVDKKNPHIEVNMV